MNKPKKDSFKVSKVKLITNGGLDCHFETETSESSEIFHDKYHAESSKDIHPDLRQKFKELRPILARIYHLTFFSELMGLDEFSATEEQESIAMKLENEILEKINVKGIAISGKDANKGIVITGTFKADSNQVMAINSHRMKFTDTRYGFEEEMKRIVDGIVDETYQFLFEGKRAQLSMFGASDFDGTDGKAEAAGKEAKELEPKEEKPKKETSKKESK